MTFDVDGWEGELLVVVETEASDDRCFSVQLCKWLCYSGHGGYKRDRDYSETLLAAVKAGSRNQRLIT